MRLSIVIPAYNEATSLRRVIDAVLTADLGTHDKEIIVVDDGSHDDTKEIMTTFPEGIIAISHPQNRGKSAAIRTGLAAATGSYVVIQDADLEYDPADIKSLVELVKEHNHVAVYGSRNLGSAQPGRFDFHMGGRVLTLLSNVLYGARLTDEPTCYKLIRRDELMNLSLEEERFGFCPEVTAKLLRRGHTIAELPISYYPRSISEGKKIRYRDGIHAVGILLKYRFKPQRTWYKEPSPDL